MDTTSKRTLASVELDSGYETFIDSLTFQQNLNASISDLIQFLLLHNLTEKHWDAVAKRFHWEEFDSAILQEVALMIHRHQYGYLILLKILPTNALQLNHYAAMVQDWENFNNSTTQSIMDKVLEVARYCNQQSRGQYLAELFYLKGRHPYSVTKWRS